MRYVILAALLAVAVASPAAAQSVPDWIKNAAGWWADGTTSDAEFLGAMQYLIGAGIISVPYAEPAGDGGAVPDWVKNAAGWWADGTTSDAEFLGAISYLINAGIILVEAPGDDSRMAQLREDLAACADYKKAYERLDCENAVEWEMTKLHYTTQATPYVVGPVTYHYPGADLEITAGGQALLTVRLLATNDGTDNITLSCSGPAICSYDVTDGANIYKYAATDFTSGSITIKPGDSREFEIVFGPNIGYGGTTFEYDPSKRYHFRISESFGTGSIPLNLE